MVPVVIAAVVVVVGGHFCRAPNDLVYIAQSHRNNIERS